MLDKAFWSGKRVLITGHTGFKGSWLSLWLKEMQAEVFGLSLDPQRPRALFADLELGRYIDDCRGDIRDLDVVRSRFKEVSPEIVFHLAAQPLVRESYLEPLETWQTNVVGTANILEALRELEEPTCAAVFVTTDKVYENKEWEFSYRETDRLGGHDPYSASKAASELLIRSWVLSYFNNESPVQLATARAGNVIGGGDWAADRIIPDIIRAVQSNDTLEVRNPDATRPWQHVLEPLFGYLTLAQKLYERKTGLHGQGFNFGPNIEAVRPVSEIIKHAKSHFPVLRTHIQSGHHPHEAQTLSLAIGRALRELDWAPKWDFTLAVEQTFQWYSSSQNDISILALCRADIKSYESALAKDPV